MARRSGSALCAALLVLGSVLTASTARAGEGAEDLSEWLDRLLLPYGDSVAAVVIDAAHGSYAYGFNDEREFDPASLFKLVVMVAAYRRAAIDPAFLQSAVTVDVPEAQGGTVSEAAVPMPVTEALERMISYSENPSAFALVRALGITEIEATARQLGLRRTSLDGLRSDQEDRRADAADVARIFAALGRGEAVSRTASDAMLALLLRQHVNDRLSDGFPAGTRFAHKTGNSSGTIHDAGIVWTPFGPRVVVVLTDGLDWPAAHELMRAIGGEVYAAPLAAERGDD